MKNEIWKDIKGYEGFYQVSNLGNVRSIAVRRSLHGKVYIIKRIRPMTPTDNGNGYLMIQLKADNRRKPVGVHRLVAEAFLPKIPGKEVIHHKDHDGHNNSVDNLEWVTQQENIDASKHLMKKAKGRCATTNTGEKYIREKNGRYRLVIRAFGVDKGFSTIDDAIEYRESIIKANPEYFERG